MSTENQSQQSVPNTNTSVEEPTPQPAPAPAPADVVLIKTKPPKQIPQRENHLRLSYLYQASTISILQNQPDIISRMYNKNFIRIQKKSVLKISPHIKRTICKKCDRLLIDGVNGTMELQNQGKNEMLVFTCSCGEMKRFPVGKKPDYELFLDRSSIDI